MEKVKVREQEKEGENDNKIFLKIKIFSGNHGAGKQSWWDWGCDRCAESATTHCWQYRSVGICVPHGSDHGHNVGFQEEENLVFTRVGP